MENNKQQETIDRLKQGLDMVNVLLEDCRKEGISLEVHVVGNEEQYKNVLYLHESNNHRFELNEAYKINKFK